MWSATADAAEDTLEQAKKESAESSVRDGAYVVRWGDTLSQIAVQLDTSVDYLATYNDVADPDVIYTGETLYFEPYASQSLPESANYEPKETLPGEEKKEKGSKARPDKPDEAAKLRFLQNRNEEGVIPRNALVKATEQAEALGEEPMPGAPEPTFSAQAANLDRNLWTWRGPGNIGGRIRSIVIHPTNPQVMWVGGVSGGIWKSDDGGASWRPLDDFMANLAVSTMAIDPTNPNVLYAGTGEGFYNADAIRGAGVFKTTDGGATWNQLSATANDSFHFVNRIVVSPSNSQVLLAATKSGIWRSTNGGSNWTQVNTNPDVTQVVFHPTNGNLAVAAGYNHALYYSTDGGATWQASSGLTVGGRVEVSYAPSNPSIVYASVDTGSGQIWKSTNGGQSYSRVGTNSYSYLGGQGWYDNAIWVDPTNANRVIVGGVDLWRSTDGGQTLSRISQWYNAPASAHADHHIMVSHPGYNGTTNKTVFFGNDGGIYKAVDATTVSGTTGWQEMNNNLGITQFYGGAGNSRGTIVGGTQDNGSLTDNGTTEGWTEMYGGDGGFSAADPTDPNYVYGEYVYLNVHRSTNGGGPDSSEYISGQYWDGFQWAWKPAPYTIPDAQNSTALFIAPFILDPNDPNRMLGGGMSLWRTNNVKAPNTNSSGPSWASIKGSIGSKISTIAVAPGNSNVVWVGHVNGDVYKTTNGTATTPSWTRVDTGTPALPNRYVGRIAIHPTDPNVAYVTFGGFSPDNVWRTADGGSTWADRSGSGTTGLPSAPVRSVTMHPNNPNWLYAGTEVGIFASEDGGSTWSLPTEGPANVSVDELFWMGTKLVAATHGRGMFTAETEDGPANDDFASAEALSGSTDTATGTNQGATKESGEPNHGGNAGGKSVWYRWTPQTSGNATINTTGSNFDTLLGVYTGSAVGSLSQVVGNDDANGGQQSEVSFQANAGTTYRIAVDGYNTGTGAATGSITLNLSAEGDNTPPSVSLTAPADNATVSGTSVALSASASDDVGVSKVDFLVDGNLVNTDTSSPYSYAWNSQSVADGFVNITAKAYDATNNSTTSAARRVAVDNTTPNTTITANPPANSTSTSATFEFSSTERDSTFRCSLDGSAYEACSSPKNYAGIPDGQHTFRVYAVGSGGAANDSDATPAEYTWNVDAQQGAANDDFASAEALSGSTDTATGTNQGATKESGEPNHGGNAGGKSVWYRWTPQTSGNATINTTGSNFDTLLGVYTGSAVGSLSQVVGNDDANGGQQSEVSFQANAGTTYRIAVDGYNTGTGAATGSITLNLSPDTTAPTVLSWSPKGKKVSPRANVTVTFSEAMDADSIRDPQTLEGTTFVLKKGTALVGARVMLDPTGKTATLDPYAKLKAGKRYTATVTTGARDEAGNPLAAAKTWSFVIRR